MKRVFVCLVVALMVALGPVGTGYALSDAEYRELLKDPDFRFEDALLGKVWKRVYGSLSAADKKILLADQRDWLKNRRDAYAADYMRQGMDKVHAYCWAVNVRTHALQMIEDAAVTNGIILSGYTDFEFTKRAIRLGVFDYLEKPVDDDELEASLKTLAIRIIEDEKDMDSISDGCSRVLKEDVQSHWIKVAIEYIGKNYMNQIALSDIARETRLSESHLSSLFKAETGINFLQYLNAVRINAAIRLLSSSSMNVSEIARSTGFPNPGYFTKIFRRFMGKTPTEYRNELPGKEVVD